MLRRHSPALVRPTFFALSLVVVGTSGSGCASPVESRQLVVATDAQWRYGELETGSFERMLTAVRSLGQQPADDEGRLAALPELLRLVLSNPSSLVRADALRSAWQLGEDFPADVWRTDALDREVFNERTQRLETIVVDEGVVASPEALELAGWLARFHAPAEQPGLAVTVSEVVLSQALWRSDPLGDVFRAELAASLHHALVAVTLHAAADPYAVVREEALAQARRMHPDTALRLIAGILGAENDSTVVLAALDSLTGQVQRLDGAELRAVLQPLADSTDVAVRRRIRDLLARIT